MKRLIIIISLLVTFLFSQDRSVIFNTRSPDSTIGHLIDINHSVANRITVANDYGIGAGATAFTQSNTISNTEARADLVVSCKGAAANVQLGALYYQQVQVSGDA